MAFTSSGATVSTGVCIYFWGIENSTVRTPLARCRYAVRIGAGAAAHDLKLQGQFLFLCHTAYPVGFPIVENGGDAQHHAAAHLAAVAGGDIGGHREGHIQCHRIIRAISPAAVTAPWEPTSSMVVNT